VSVVIDASATLALLFGETGSNVVEASSRHSLLSAVNLDEVLHKGLSRKGLPFSSTLAFLRKLEIIVAPFDAAQAEIAAAHHERLHRLDVAFGDRACMALAFATERPLLTADRAWSTLGLDLQIIQIR
jgi:ribonuclease VapC